MPILITVMYLGLCFIENLKKFFHKLYVKNVGNILKKSVKTAFENLTNIIK